MSTQQLSLSMVLATMVFSVALELKLADFTRVAQQPRAVACGRVPQFVLLPVGTWLATLVLDLPPNVEAAMILVAACPGGSLSNVVTHFGRSNTALSVSISAVAAVLPLFLTPFNFTWVRDCASDKLTLERSVEMMTSRNARYLGLKDRGTIGVGQRADLNLIEPQRLSVGVPALVRDLPAGGKRFLQKGLGYLGTWVAGQCVQRDGEVTAARPGRLVRAGR